MIDALWLEAPPPVTTVLWRYYVAGCDPLVCAWVLGAYHSPRTVRRMRVPDPRPICYGAEPGVLVVSASRGRRPVTFNRYASRERMAA